MTWTSRNFAWCATKSAFSKWPPGFLLSFLASPPESFQARLRAAQALLGWQLLRSWALLWALKVSTACPRIWCVHSTVKLRMLSIDATWIEPSALVAFLQITRVSTTTKIWLKRANHTELVSSWLSASALYRWKAIEIINYLNVFKLFIWSVWGFGKLESALVSTIRPMCLNFILEQPWGHCSRGVSKKKWCVTISYWIQKDSANDMQKDWSSKWMGVCRYRLSYNSIW